MPMKKQQQQQKRKSKRGPRVSPALPLAMVFPTTKQMTFVATFRIAITESAAGTGQFAFIALNNLYDVLSAAGGPATAGLSAMSSFYRNYRVDSARLRLEGVTAAAGTGVAIESCLTPTGITTTLSASPENWSIMPGAVSQITSSALSGSGKPNVLLDKTYDIPKLLGISRAKYEAEDNYSSVFNGSPATQVYVAMTTYGMAGATGAATLNGRYRVVMRATLYNPVAQTP